MNIKKEQKSKTMRLNNRQELKEFKKHMNWTAKLFGHDPHNYLNEYPPQSGEGKIKDN